MIATLPDTPELRAVAERIIWFKSSSDALRNPIHFIAYLLTYGTHEDIQSVRQYVSDSDLRYALDHAPPGIIDPRSWAYWNLMLDRYPPPPLPVRQFPQ